MARILLLGVVLGASMPGQPALAPTAPEPLATFGDRMRWVANTSVSPRRMAGYAISSAISTASNAPPEYGPHWDGYGKRVGLRLSTGATGLMMEASIGHLWGEDPRYHHALGKPVRGRLWNVVKMSFMATNREGKVVPAYARYISIPANSFLSNAWRADSHATTERALSRIQLSFVDRMIGNAFSEFWPDLMKVFHRKSHVTEPPLSDSTK